MNALLSVDNPIPVSQMVEVCFICYDYSSTKGKAHHSAEMKLMMIRKAKHLPKSDLTRDALDVPTVDTSKYLKNMFNRALHIFVWWYRFSTFSFSTLAIVIIFNFKWTNNLGNT